MVTKRDVDVLRAELKLMRRDLFRILVLLVILQLLPLVFSLMGTLSRVG